MNPAADIWAKVLALMQNEMTTTTINTWFDDTTAVELEGDRFVLYSPTRFKRDIIATRYVSKIQTALRDLFSCDMEVTVLTEGELDQYQQEPEKNDFFPGTEEYTFERFVVGSSNKFAHAAARAVATGSGKDWGSTSTSCDRPMVFMALAAAPMLPGWLVRERTTRTRPSAPSRFILKCAVFQIRVDRWALLPGPADLARHPCIPL